MDSRDIFPKFSTKRAIRLFLRVIVRGALDERNHKRNLAPSPCIFFRLPPKCDLGKSGDTRGTLGQQERKKENRPSVRADFSLSRRPEGVGQLALRPSAGG